jgi:hypothetical protein
LLSLIYIYIEICKTFIFLKKTFFFNNKWDFPLFLSSLLSLSLTVHWTSNVSLVHPASYRPPAAPLRGLTYAVVTTLSVFHSTPAHQQFTLLSEILHREYMFTGIPVTIAIVIVIKSVVVVVGWQLRKTATPFQQRHCVSALPLVFQCF